MHIINFSELSPQLFHAIYVSCSPQVITWTTELNRRNSNDNNDDDYDDDDDDDGVGDDDDDDDDENDDDSDNICSNKYMFRIFRFRYVVCVVKFEIVHKIILHNVRFVLLICL